jgi:putative ABC transport system permease protein
VVLTAALGVGSATAIYTLAHSILLRPLPFPGSERVVALCEVAAEDAGYCVASPPNVRDLARLAPGIEAAGVARTWRFRRPSGAEPSSVNVGIATPGFLQTYSADLLHGRMFTDAELQQGANDVLVLSYALWQRWAGANPDVVGQSTTLDGREFRIIGVLAPDVWIPQFEHAEAWAPLTTTPDNPEQRDWRGFVAAARLRATVNLDQARDQLRTAYASLAAEYPDLMSGFDLQVVRLRDQLGGEVRPMLTLFGVAVVCLLLIACANVANLLIVRAQGRAAEVAVRSALGAGRVRLAAHMLTESLVLGAAGGVAGLALATGLVALGLRWAPAGIPRVDEVAVDTQAAIFAVAVSLATALLFGFVPALRVARADISSVLRSGRFGDRDAARTRRGILVLQLALAMTLLTGAGLGIRGFVGLLRWDPGFDRQGLVTTWVSADYSQFESGADIVRAFAAAAAEIAAIPGVDAIGQSSAGPLFGGIETGTLVISGRVDPDEAVPVQWFDIGPGYFDALGVSLRRGRGLTPQDDAGSAPVAVVNESFVRRFGPDGDLLGTEVVVADHAATVVGVVGDVRPLYGNEPVRPAVYWPKAQFERGATYFILRTALAPEVVERLARARLGTNFDRLAFTRFGSLQERLDGALVTPRFQVLLLVGFAAAALLLAGVGTYAIVAYTVAQDTHAIGVRLALGARPARIVRQVLGSGVRLALVGGGLGVLGALALGGWLEATLYGVSSTDPVTLAIVVGIFIAITMLACWLPARRASSVDPVAVLGGE